MEGGRRKIHSEILAFGNWAVAVLYVDYFWIFFFPFILWYDIVSFDILVDTSVDYN